MYFCENKFFIIFIIIIIKYWWLICVWFNFRISLVCKANGVGYGWYILVKYTEAQSSIKSGNACILCFILAMVRFIYHLWEWGFEYGVWRW